MLNNEYWEGRYRAEEKARELADKRVAYQLQGIYQQHANNIQKEIDSFWQMYADKEGITKLEAKQRADKLDMVNVEFKARQLVERANRLRERGQKVTSDDFTRAENDLMRLYNLKMKTSRLEVLQANIKLHQYDLALSEFEIIDKHLIESIRRENLFSAGVLNMTLGSFESSKISADSIVYANFSNATWSSRVWERQNELRNIVKKGVADTVLRGKGTNVLINSLKKEFDVSYGYARRLAVTESARVYSEAQKANYESNEVEWYEVMTELKACQICQPFNGRIFKVSEMVPALNAPPFHPNCRCTTVPHFLIDLKRVGRDEEFLHADMNNKNQSSKYIAEDKGKMYNQDTRETKARFYSGQLLSKISKAEPKITSDMQRIAGENQLAGLEFRKKTAESLARKITADSQVENISSAEAASKINDALRYTTIFDSDTFTEEYSKMKQKLIAEGYRVVKVKNTWITNGPYKGVNTVIEKDGINFEMQYHTQESFDLKNGPLHELYEKRRLSSTTKAERHKLDAEMVKLSKTLKVPKNIERVE